MTSVVDQARRLLGRGTPDLPARVDGLRRAVEACRGRVDEEPVQQAADVVERVGTRLQLSGDQTVVALAGATGSGKSSTFNALTGLDLAATGVRRPTTSWTMSCTWGEDGSEDLLEWLEVPRRHRVSRSSMLDTSTAEERDLAGLVLLDLPDHDSTEVAHHVEVDRLVAMADLLVWVLDPQKYADAAVHERYLRPLAGHQEILLVVLNHIDEVPEERRPEMLADLRRLLEADGLGEVPVLATSARHGEGVAELKAHVAARVRDKEAVTARSLADLARAARRLQEASGAGAPSDLPGRTGPDRVAEMVEAFAEAAGVPTVVHAVERSSRRRAIHATGWPVTSWLGRLKPDPLRRLHLDVGAEGRRLVARPRASMPELTHVQRARVDAAVRAVADQEAEGLPRPWADAVRTASVSRLTDLTDALDRAVSEVELGVKTPWWCRLVQGFQWVLLLAALSGLVWLISLGAGGTLVAPVWYGWSVPALLVAIGVGGGLLLSLVCQGLIRISARLRARAARRRLRAAVTEVTQRLVVAPVWEELDAYEAAQAGLADALR